MVEDGEPVAQALRACLAEGVDLVVTTGGTGISPTDRTPEATAEVLDFELPGLADAIRAEGQDTVPTAMLSRGLAGVAGRTLVVNLPGSRGGVITSNRRTTCPPRRRPGRCGTWDQVVLRPGWCWLR